MRDAEFQKLMGQMVIQFTAAVHNTGFYPVDHPQTVSSTGDTCRLLEELFDEKKEITVLLIGDSLMTLKRPLIISRASETAFIQILKNNEIERVTFIKGLTRSQLEDFARRLATGTTSGISNLDYLKFGKLEIKNQNKEDIEADSLDPETPAIYDVQGQNTERMIKDIYKNTVAGGKINLANTDEIISQFMENIHRSANPLRLLADTKSNDEYTFTHTANVGILAMFLAENLGFKGSSLTDIGVAALLHDVGKMKVPEEILSKPGPLTPDERKILESHPLKGAFFLMEQTGINNLAILGALEHHMKYNGTGYPHLKGHVEQSIVGQIISIVDVYDALRTTRPYRPYPLPEDRIIQIFRDGSGTEFNPYLVERFLRLTEKKI